MTVQATIPSRLMKRKEAAAWCHLSPAGFDRWVRLGILPRKLPGTNMWDIRAIEMRISVAVERGAIPVNPCAGGKKFSKGNRSAFIWTDSQIAAFREHASEPLREALLLAIHTGQRQGDLLRLTWSAYDGKAITLRQRKTGKHVRIPVRPELKGILDAKKRISTQILTNSRGRPWTSDGFKSSWAAACKTAKVTGVTFHDLRGTAVVQMAEVGCTEAEIAAITGHSLSRTKSMLEAYWSPTMAQAEAAMRKLEEAKARTKL